MTHELTKESEMSSYFAQKFAPAPPSFVVGRSYQSEPECKPEETLFDNWVDRSRTHAHSLIILGGKFSLIMFGQLLFVFLGKLSLIIVVQKSFYNFGGKFSM